MFKFDEFITISVSNLKNNDLFINSGSFIIKVLEHNYNKFVQHEDNVIRIV